MPLLRGPHRRRGPHRLVGWIAVGSATLISVGACSHAGGSAGKNASAGGVPQLRTAPEPAAAAHGASAGGVFGPAAGESGGRADATPLDDALGAKIRTAQLAVTLRRAALVRPAATEAAGIALAAGGEVDADDRTSGAAAVATMQLRVPPEALEPTLDKLSALGTEQSRTLSTVDVTEKVADVNSRVQSARDAVARLRALFSDATKVADVIAVEGELTERESDLESLEAQQRALTRQTSMALITLTLQTAPKAAVRSRHHTARGGFVGGLERGWHGFTSAAGWLASALGTVLPFLILFLVIGLAGRLAWSRLPHRPRPAPTPAE